MQNRGLWCAVRSRAQRFITDRFHVLYYGSGAFSRTHWMGVQTLKCPLDLWVYQEIVHEVQPDVIVECGTYRGGSALFLACICDALQQGIVVTIDIEDWNGRPQHPRIRYLCGSTTDPAVVECVSTFITEGNRVMVVLDSDHHYQHVIEEMRLYSRIVTPGSYLIVEDTNLNRHPVFKDFGPGPMEAVVTFLRENDSFVIDQSREKFHLTFNPKGYLKRTM